MMRTTMSRSSCTSKRSAHGAAMVEMAILIALLVVLFIGITEIGKDIATSANDLEVVIRHGSISFMRFKRDLIRSISRRGVAIPFVDFFWNAWTTQIASPI